MRNFPGGVEKENDASVMRGEVASTPDMKAIPVNRRVEDIVRPAVHMDSTVFGFGCCCLQVTLQAKDVDESRFIYDQLAVMAPMSVFCSTVSYAILLACHSHSLCYCILV